MKISMILFTILFLGVSCKKNDSYTINGSFKGSPSEDWIYMVKFLDDYANRDSAKIENGKFKFEGTIDVPEVYAFHYRMDKIIGIASGFIEPGVLDLKIDLENWDLNSKITGGKITDEFNKLEADRVEKFMAPIWELNKKRQTASTDEAIAINDSLKTLQKANEKYEMDYISRHLNSPISVYLLFKNQFSLSTEEKGIILSKFDKSLHNTTIYKTMFADYENQAELKEQEYAKHQTQDIQIIQTGFKDKSILETLIEQNPNKVLYIDIWGTWCGPCKKEFPYSKKLFDEIDLNKTQMIFLCIGSKKEEWEQMIKSENLRGQHYLVDDDNMNKFNQENQLEIQGIPRYLIVGKDGKIKDKNAPRPSSEEIKRILAQFAE